MIERAPDKALAYARDWEVAKGLTAFGAKHCDALALTALGRDAEAAITLSGLALAMKDKPKDAQAAVFAQAADSWLLSGNLERARVAIDQALALHPTTDYLLVRARIRANAKDWEGVRSDTGTLLEKEPSLPEALTLRATALRNLDYKTAALADANRAVENAPHDLSALLERGRIKAAMLDMPGARADWLSVVDYAAKMGRQGDPRAVAAQAFLDIGTGK
jgi:tetratricopeptide (TPR) repeat protein